MTQNKRMIEYIAHYKEHENRTLDDKNGGTEKRHRQKHDIRQRGTHVADNHRQRHVNRSKNIA